MLRKILTSSIISLVILGGFFVSINTNTANIEETSSTITVSMVDSTYAATECG